MTVLYVNEYYRCSEDYIDNIDKSIREDIEFAIGKIPLRETQVEINGDFVWLLSNRGWTISGFPSSKNYIFDVDPPSGIELKGFDRSKVKSLMNKDECKITTTLNLEWHADFSKRYGNKRIMIEIQFGKIEAAFRDACRFAITYRERRLDLGILIVMNNPKEYFEHRKKIISGMADFDTLRKTLVSINLDCPIWLIGMNKPSKQTQLTF